MGKVIVEKITYGQWGSCLRITNGIVDLVASLDFGPRIIRFGFIDKENMFFEDINFEAANVSEEMNIFGKSQWKIYGGHRLWTSPEANPRTYYPDHEPVVFEELEKGAVLRANEEKWTQLQKEIEIRLEENTSNVTITHKITNKNAWPIKITPWAITVMAPGGKEVIPQPKRDTGLLANKVIALWPYSKMNDKRIYWGEKYIILQQDPSERSDFKLGINNEDGWGAYFNYNSLFIKRYNHNIDGVYPDNGVSYETFTKHLFLEMETLGELKVIGYGETVEHKEEWGLYDNISMPENDENEIYKILK